MLFPGIAMVLQPFLPMAHLDNSVILSETERIEISVSCAFDNSFDLIRHCYFKDNKSSLSAG